MDCEENEERIESKRRPTAEFRAAVKAGKERPRRGDVGGRDRGLGDARDRLHECLDELVGRVPTVEELARLTVVANRAFVPRSAAVRLLGAFVRYVENLHTQVEVRGET